VVRRILQHGSVEVLAEYRKPLMHAIHFELWLHGRLTPATSRHQEPYKSAYLEQSNVSA
jgi:hypothetical protein